MMKEKHNQLTIIFNKRIIKAAIVYLESQKRQVPVYGISLIQNPNILQSSDIGT